MDSATPTPRQIQRDALHDAKSIAWRRITVSSILALVVVSGTVALTTQLRSAPDVLPPVVES
ncbi:MAG: hypothetical protein OEX97_07145, partial [Acidimicrobiia bacterium]|nr:hypothetical protein [Acidimicrobiia bacterium]